MRMKNGEETLVPLMVVENHDVGACRRTEGVTWSKALRSEATRVHTYTSHNGHRVERKNMSGCEDGALRYGKPA